MTAIHQESISTIAILKKRLKTKLNKHIQGILIFTPVVIYCFLMNEPAGIIPLGGMFILYGITILIMWLYYRQLNTNIDFTKPVLSYSQEQNQLIRKVLTFEKLWGTFFMPLALLCAGVGGAYYGERTISEFLDSPTKILVFLLIIFASGPLFYLDTARKNRIAFGSLLNNLENNIRRMKDLSES